MEKRSSTRKTMQRPLKLEVATPGAGNAEIVQHEALMMDICHRGLGLTTEQCLKAGDVLKIAFPVSDERIPLPVLASVVWSMVDGDVYRAGLQFLL